MFIASSVPNADGFIYHTPSEIPVNVFTKITIGQKKLGTGEYQYYVAINNSVVQATTHTNAKEYENMKVYMGDPWYPPADNIIVKNLKFNTPC